MENARVLVMGNKIEQKKFIQWSIKQLWIEKKNEDTSLNNVSMDCVMSCESYERLFTNTSNLMNRCEKSTREILNEYTIQLNRL